MIKQIINSLAVSLNNSINSNELREKGFDYLIKDVDIHGFYSVKFNMSDDRFVDFAYYRVNAFFDSLDDEYEFFDIMRRWYRYYIENKTLFSKTRSLRSDCRRWFKKNKGSLQGFDRFFERILLSFIEAYGTYEVVFYSIDAFVKSDFQADRKSCFFDRSDFLDVLKQLPSFYVLVYKDKKPIMRFLAVLDNKQEEITIFNRYGLDLIEYFKLFANEEEVRYVSNSKLSEMLGIYINEGSLVSQDAKIEDFIFTISCPTCGTQTNTSQLVWFNEKLRSIGCCLTYNHSNNRYMLVENVS